MKLNNGVPFIFNLLLVILIWDLLDFLQLLLSPGDREFIKLKGYFKPVQSLNKLFLYQYISASSYKQLFLAQEHKIKIV